MIRILILALLLPAGSLLAQTAVYQQVIDLEPGWNAVYLQVQPEDNRIATVLADIPVASVWRWIPGEAGSRYVTDPAEGLENIEGWFGWFPEPRPEAFLTNLFRFNANTAYLIRVEGNESHQVALEGRPIYRRLGWNTDAFTLVGLPVAEANPPTFAEFFAESPAHQSQPIYRLQSNGQWSVVNPASTAIRAGEAYWVYTEGNSNFQGKLNLVLEQGESLEYSAALDEIRIVLRNRSQQDGSFLVRRLGTTELPLAFRNEDPETGDVGWPFLPGTLFLDAPARSDVFLTLGILRQDFSASRMEEVLEITDEFGERILVHAGGNTIQPFVAPVRGIEGSGGASLAGLWMGEVEIDAVSESQQAGVIPESAPQTFTQRVLIHVDTAGQVRLLKDVIQMWQDGTLRPSAIDPEFQEVDEPGRYVLITDSSLLGLYSGALNRAGASVGLRYSTIAYDFEGDAQLFDGEFGPGSQISTTLVIEPDLPTNPFLHRYHPDHDNRDAQFLNFRAEAYQVVREMRLIFTEEDLQGNNPPGWGETLVGGLFEESITGLHKNTIFTSGQFRLRRISAVPVLNQ